MSSTQPYSQDDLNEILKFYKQSLKQAGENINKIKQNKALKDVVGKEYEEHRKRVWENLGFTVDKKRNGAAFDVDWSVYKDGVLVAIEEDKGHYVDSCFLERCLISFAKSVNNYKNEKVPKLILSSFTQYNLFNEKLVEVLDIVKEEIGETLKKQTHYKYLNHNDRFNKKQWFKQDSSNIDNPYELYQNDELIKEDIRFMLSLKE